MIPDEMPIPIPPSPTIQLIKGVWRIILSKIPWTTMSCIPCRTTAVQTLPDLRRIQAYMKLTLIICDVKEDR